MVQEFHVVRCFRCEIFQVQQVKKVNRWSCKMCGEKQSLLKEFGRGSGADCRCHVQKLNAMRGAMIGEQEHNTRLLWEQVEVDVEEKPEERDNQVRQTRVSRWSKYKVTPREAEMEEENVLMDRQQLHGSGMTERKRKRIDTPEKNQTSSSQRSSCSSLTRRPVGPSASTRTTIPTHTSPPSLNQSSPFNQVGTSPPMKKRINPPSQNSGPVSKWIRFLGSGCQLQEGEGPSTSGGNKPIGGATSLSCGDIITRPRPMLPVSSQYEIGEEFSFDDEDFLS